MLDAKIIGIHVILHLVSQKDIIITLRHRIPFENKIIRCNIITSLIIYISFIIEFCIISINLFSKYLYLYIYMEINVIYF